MENRQKCSEPCQFSADCGKTGFYDIEQQQRSPQEHMSAVPRNVSAFERIATELSDLYRRKNNDYGDSFGKSYAAYGPISALTRISDKFHRLEHLILDGSPQVDESLEDTLRDLASYAIMTLVARQEGK